MKYYKKRETSSRSGHKRKWSITVGIILLNISIFIFLWAYFMFNAPDLNNPSSISLPSYFLLKPSNILEGKFLSSIILHMFTHTLFLHLFVNMFVLFSLGMFCERIIGRKRYIWFYLIAGLFAGILSILLSGFYGSTPLGERVFGPPDIFMTGASGAIFGIAALLMMLIPKLKFSIIFLPFFSIPAYIIIPAAVFIMWGLTIIFDLPIGNVAHFGGFLVGVIYGLYLRVKYKRKVAQLQRMFG